MDHQHHQHHHIEVVGRHSLLVDDDAASAFVNSTAALVPWSGDDTLLIDRFDVRHLLQHLPSLIPPLTRRRPPQQDQQDVIESDGVARSDLDLERYLDLSRGDDDGRDEDEQREEARKQAEMPPTEKVHQIISRTATFVSEHGGQSEIVLRVKQGNNPTFGFLMPDHHLHAYFRFLVDHPELTKAAIDSTDRPEEKSKTASGDNESHVAGGALSLLGSVYGSGDDDEVVPQVTSDLKEMELNASEDGAIGKAPHRLERASPTNMPEEAKTIVKHPTASKVNALMSKQKSFATAATAGVSKKRETDTGSLNVSMKRPQAQESDSGPLILEPPSFLKRTMDKVVEFILRNGKEFEAVLIEQDRMNGRFSFLLPSSQYHPFYLKLLQEAEESKLPGKNHGNQKIDSMGHVGSTRKIRETKCEGSAADIQSRMSPSEYPFDTERKEKFKMVIGGSKKDIHDALPKPAKQAGMSPEEAAAIVMAATRGLSHTKLDTLPKMSVDDSGAGPGIGEGGPSSSFGSHSSFPDHNSSQKTVSNGKTGTSLLGGSFKPTGEPSKEGHGTVNDVLVANAIAKTVAGEADSSEACLTREQKQKAERLKRAKMFAAMIKSGKKNTSELLPAAIAQSGSQGGTAGSILSGPEPNHAGMEREGSSVPTETEILMKKSLEKVDNTASRNMSRSSHHEQNSEGEHKHSRKRNYRSKHISHSDKDECRCKRHESSDEERAHFSGDEQKHKRHHSSKSKHQSSSEDEHAHSRSKSRRRHKHYSSSDDEHRQKKSSGRHRKRHRSERKQVEKDKKISDNPKEDDQEGTIPSVSEAQPSVASEVPADLRAKIRAMLLETM